MQWVAELQSKVGPLPLQDDVWIAKLRLVRVCASGLRARRRDALAQKRDGFVCSHTRSCDLPRLQKQHGVPTRHQFDQRQDLRWPTYHFR